MSAATHVFSVEQVHLVRQCYLLTAVLAFCQSVVLTFCACVFLLLSARLLLVVQVSIFLSLSEYGMP